MSAGATWPASPSPPKGHLRGPRTGPREPLGLRAGIPTQPHCWAQGGSTPLVFSLQYSQNWPGQRRRPRGQLGVLDTSGQTRLDIGTHTASPWPSQNAPRSGAPSALEGGSVSRLMCFLSVLLFQPYHGSQSVCLHTQAPSLRSHMLQREILHILSYNLLPEANLGLGGPSFGFCVFDFFVGRLGIIASNALYSLLCTHESFPVVLGTI